MRSQPLGADAGLSQLREGGAEDRPAEAAPAPQNTATAPVTATPPTQQVTNRARYGLQKVTRGRCRDSDEREHKKEHVLRASSG